jgi:hypothetical protein
MPMSTEQIRKRGLAALRDALGRAGMVRFLQQFEQGSGDYTRERRKWVDHMSLEDIMREARRLRRRGRGSKRRS